MIMTNTIDTRALDDIPPHPQYEAIPLDRHAFLSLALTYSFSLHTCLDLLSIKIKPPSSFLFPSYMFIRREKTKYSVPCCCCCFMYVCMYVCKLFLR